MNIDTLWIVEIAEEIGFSTDENIEIGETIYLSHENAIYGTATVVNKNDIYYKAIRTE